MARGKAVEEQMVQSYDSVAVRFNCGMGVQYQKN